MYGYGYSIKSVILGGGASVDPDAAAFLTAASITDPTITSAIDTLVVDLKDYGIWTKMKALYPFVGGTASTHKFNLKDPRDLDAAFRLTFNGGWTHSVNGVKPNGTNAFANTYLFSNSITSAHLSVYSRENISTGVAIDIGAVTSAADRYWLAAGFTSNNDIVLGFGNSLRTSAGSAQGFFTGTLTGTTSTLLKNGSQLSTGSTVIAALPSNIPLYVGGSNGVSTYSNRELAFSSVGDYLNNTEAANFYTAVQTFQTSLGRSIGTQTVSDADAQAFVTNAGIVDQVEATAINNLVIGMKADGLWTKMKAVYPFVGGSNTSTSYNLKNTAQYQIAWAGGITSSANGVTGNGSNSYGNTGFNPNTVFSTNDSAHLSLYIRNNSASSAYVDFGATNGAGSSTALNSAFTNSALSLIHNGNTGISTSNTNTQGFYLGSRTTASVHKLFKNTAQIGSTDTTSAGIRPNLNLFLGAYSVNGVDLYHTNRNYAFASIGDGLTDTDATNLNSRVTTFQTALNRNV